MTAKLTCALLALLAVSTLAVGNAAAGDDDRLKKLIKSRGYATIKIIEAKVPDMDPFPTQGDSDVFYKVSLVAATAVSGNTTLCASPVVQDSNKPKHDFECATKQAIPGNSVILIEVLDSDKPDSNSDVIGVAEVPIADIIFNQSLDSVQSYKIKDQEYPKYHIKAKVSYKPIDK